MSIYVSSSFKKIWRSLLAIQAKVIQSFKKEYTDLGIWFLEAFFLKNWHAVKKTFYVQLGCCIFFFFLVHEISNQCIIIVKKNENTLKINEFH